MDGTLVNDPLKPMVNPANPPKDNVIVGRSLVKRFGRTVALDGLDINVPRGSVYALLGRNGVGKSTLIQLVIGMLEPTAGSISVLGLNPTKDDVAVKQVLGYIPERMQMYDWMTVDQVLEFVAGIYKNWSREDENQLAEKFRLVRHQKVGALSRGNRALLSLVIAMAHQPELVLLDECTSGMDAIARREFERSVIDALSGSGRTVLFAGHQIDEMERICDWVGILHDGKMLLEMTLDDLKRTIVGLRLTAAESLPTVLNNCKILSSRTSGKESYVTVRFDSPLGAIYDAASGIKVNEVVPLSLEEIFVAAVEAEENK